MDRLNQLRGDAGASRDSTLDTSSLRSEAYLTANESSKYFSLSEDDSTFGASPSKEVEIETTSETITTDTERIISNLSPIPKKNELDSFKIGDQIEAANILSGGVNIFDDNENSYDEDELVIDDAVQEGDDKSTELKLSESHEMPFEKTVETSLDDAEAASPSKDTEVVLQIDGKNVDAIDIGNGLYLYRKDGEEELAAVQITDNEPNIKFLKVRENAEGNLEVYEEIEIEVSKEVPTKEGKTVKNTSQIPVKDVNKVSEPIQNKVAETSCQPQKDSTTSELQSDLNKDNTQTDPKSEVNLNGKMMKFSESRKSPLIGTFTPMTYHSTPNKEGIPLTKTMVDLQLHPSRHSENVKKTIEVHTDHCKQRLLETPAKNSRVSNENNKSSEITSPSKQKELSNDPAVDKPDNVTIEIAAEKTDLCDQERNKHNSATVMKNPEEKIAIDVCNANAVKNVESTSFAKDNLVSNIKDDKTELSARATPSQLEESLPTTGVKCKLITNDPASENAAKDRNLKEKCSSNMNALVGKDSVTAKLPQNEVEPSNVIEKLQESVSFSDFKEQDKKGNVNETSVIPSNTVTTKLEQDEVVPKTVTEHLKETIKSSDFEVHDNIRDNRNSVKEMGDTGMEDLTKTGIINSQKEIMASENKRLNNIIDVTNEVQSKRESSSETKVKTVIDLEQKLQSSSKLESSSVDVKTKNIIDFNEKSIACFPNKDSTKKESDQDLKITENEIKHDINKPFETYHNKMEKNKTFKDIDTNESKDQPASLLKIAPTDGNITTETLTESPVKSVDLLEDDKKEINKQCNMSQGSISKVDEKKSDSLKQLKDSIKVLQNAHKETEAKTVNYLEQQRNEPNTNMHKNYTKLKVSPIKRSEGIDQLPDVQKNPSLELKNIQKEPNKALENIPEGEKIEKEKYAAVKQLDNSMSGKSTATAINLATSNDLIGMQTNIVTTGQNSLTHTHNLQSVSTNKTPVSEPNKNLLIGHGKNPTTIQEVERKKVEAKNETVKVSKSTLPKPINNNKAAVPFGKWTEANRQEFLNKIKEAKIPTNTSNTKQLKQPNDLNRRDVLQKIDSQRQSTFASAKVQELNTTNKNKNEQSAFINKSNLNLKEKAKNSKVPLPVTKPEEIVSKTSCVDKAGQSSKTRKDQHIPIISVDMSSTTLNTKKESVQRKEINNQDLIDKTIEGIINRAVIAKHDDPKHGTEPLEKLRNTPAYTPVSLDEIESKMNELHGIPFVERPPHELPKVLDQEKPRENKNIVKPDMPTASKNIKVPKLLPFPNKPSSVQKIEEKISQPINKEGERIEDSDEDIIEHEPVTADSELIKNKVLPHVLAKDNLQLHNPIHMRLSRDSKKEPIITENDFDKFARRNSITYENCLTVNFDGKEQHNVVQSVIEKEVVTKKLSRNEIMLAESKAKSNKHLLMRHNNISSKVPTPAKPTAEEDSYTKNYQSKVQIAYHSAMTAKRQQESPITIIEDKPVKVVFMDSNHDFVPQELILQGKELSPPKKTSGDYDHFTHSNSESMDSDVLETAYDSKLQDEIKSKSKHQRKQVLTPVEAPELELIEPGDLGIEVSPKKKRKIEDNKLEKSSKALVPKKTYLLNRNLLPDEANSNPQDLTTTTLQEPTINKPDMYKHSDAISAIDNLVKAAELIETQSENKQVVAPSDENSSAQQNTPIKRGRGRPRKYPLPETVSTNSKSPSPVKTPTPQKKPRLIDAKIRKIDTESEDDDISSDGELIKENWTMGKINENIVCPICNKLFRSENVVFKHVKHCTGPSPSRSDSDKRSPRRGRQSQELDWKSEESKSDSMDIDEENEINKPTKKRKSKDKNMSTTHEKKTDVTKNISVEDKNADVIKSTLINEKTTDNIRNASVDQSKSDGTKDTSINERKTEVIVIEDTPIKETLEKRDKEKDHLNKATGKTKLQHRTSNLVCEYCGKTFRQLSYLVSHKLQHKNKESKKVEQEQVLKSLFSCEICKKEFRKLHHLVQHRIIHNPNPITSRSSRKSSSEQSEGKTKHTSKPSEDQSAGFRCEPCDKSFRKLHHLVEHRETHDEINKKCSTAIINNVDTTKLNPLHNCDICKKSFKKLQHLMEHKEHHVDTSSEKSDDKSVKSSLSTKDIIHECPLCYMVFPNEHSLNKHNINCQRKKKQAAKNIKKIDENNEDDVDDSQDEEAKVSESEEEKVTIAEKPDIEAYIALEEETLTTKEKEDSIINTIEEPLEAKQEKVIETVKELKTTEVEMPSEKPQLPEKDIKDDGGVRNVDKMPLKSRKHSISTQAPVEIIKIPDTPTPRKKLLSKEKTGATVTKRQKTSNAPLALIDNNVKHTDSSDDDEVRYMLNPDFVEQSKEGKMFIKVRAKKRNSLQIERPNSKDLVKRRISLQHPPKIPRLKAKPVPRKPTNTTVVKSTKPTPIPPDPVPSTDSDDSDVKYSFPVTVKNEVEPKDVEKKAKRQTIVEKRKSLSGIAKRKSMGKTVSAKHKVNTSPAKQIKRRTKEVEHRCDCGALFSSAALLARHASLAHTPPRVRRRRSPPPSPPSPTPDAHTTDTHSSKPKPATRKSSDAKATSDARKTARAVAATRRGPHKGVPVPEKMRKLAEKSKK